MRQLVLAWLVLVGLAFALAGSCAIDHRSGAFECTKTSDCDSPRVCSDGLCILPGGGVDARPSDAKRPDGPPDSFECPEQCTSCNPSKNECTIDCAAGANCNQPITCPEKWNCVIRCNTTDACRSGVNCQAGEACDIQCTGSRACRNVVCGQGPCNVNCTGPNGSCLGVSCGLDRCNVNCMATGSCRDIACKPSCACDVTCATFASCEMVDCTAPQCDLGRNCSSVPFNCNTCQ